MKVIVYLKTGSNFGIDLTDFKSLYEFINSIDWNRPILLFSDIAVPTDNIAFIKEDKRVSL